jgi:hypothetical protein
MEQSPSWDANWFSATQEIPPILWNTKAHYPIHNCPPPVRILGQLDPVYTQVHFLLHRKLLYFFYKEQTVYII